MSGLVDDAASERRSVDRPARRDSTVPRRTRAISSRLQHPTAIRSSTRCISTPSSRSSTTCSTTSTARRWRTRSRSASRSSITSSSSSARRLRAAEGARADDEVPAEARRTRPRSGSRSSTSGSSGSSVAPSAAGSAQPAQAARSTSTCSRPSARYAEFLDARRRRGARPAPSTPATTAACTSCSSILMLEVWLRPICQRAEPAPAARSRRMSDRLSLRGRSPRPGTSARTSRGSPPASARRQRSRCAG